VIDDEAQSFPLIGSIQNSVAMGFIGNQASLAVVNGLGARLVFAQSQFSNAHGGVPGRTSAVAEVNQFRRDVDFVVQQRPGIIHVGYLPKPQHVDAVASALKEYKGVILVDPVIGDFKKGLYVSEETARSIKDWLIPLAQIITPNRFEADVLLGTGEQNLNELQYLNGLFDIGVQAVIVTSFTKDPEKHRTTSLFSNGYSYYRVNAPYFPRYPGHGVGDVFAAAVASFVGLGGSPFAATLLATTLATRAVANTTHYGGNTVDPVSVLTKWNPTGYQVDDERTMRFCERSNVQTEQLKPNSEDTARLKFAPPKNQIIYG
jgi:pyridoxine kinase